MIPALIVDRGGRLDLGATRMLGGAGVPVHIVLTRGGTISARSRWCSATHELPFPDNEDAFVSELEALASRLADRHGQRPVMLFTWERIMLLAARHRERLEQVIRLDLSPRDALEAAIDKRKFALLAEQAGLPVPKSVTVATADDIDSALQLQLPIFVKPPTNMSWDDLARRLGIAEKGTRVDSASVARGLLGKIVAENRSAIVQECLEGPDEGHASVHLFRDHQSGEFLAACTIRRARVYPAHAGLACFVVSEPLQHLIPESQRALRELGLYGSASVQWKEDINRGWRILEVGPRVALSMSIGRAARVNVPFIAYQSLTGVKPETPGQRYGVAWIDLQHDLDSLKTYRRTGEWNLLRWCSSLRRVRAAAFFDPRDIKPWLHQLRYHAAY